jgi:hypothetical protein
MPVTRLLLMVNLPVEIPSIPLVAPLSPPMPFQPPETSSSLTSIIGGQPRLDGPTGKAVLQSTLAALQSAATGKEVRPVDVK